LIMCNLMKYVFNKLDKVSKNVECIIHGKYNIKDDFKEEGIFNIIHSDLNKLSKSINIKIKNLDKEKENIKELVTDISHQLKTPLASLKLYNSLLLEEDLEEEDRTEFLKTSGMSINKLQSLVESLVNISRLETSMISIKKENKNIKATIIKAIESVKPKSINKFISINLNDFDDKIVPHDPKWTEECIFNILDNAVKYTNLKGKIDIYVQDAINFIRIDIKDNGIGIDKNEFNNIFKRFYRSEEVQDLEGSGVGLYLSRKILEIQGGNIIVSSQKGEGSKFSLFLTKV
ncbi:MAG: sensor histidine kinase, partial [Paraclostridium bifermentans]